MEPRSPHKSTEPHLKEVLEHIEKYYVSNLNSSSSDRAGVPTLLGAVISTLDAAEKFGDPEISRQAKKLRTRVIQEYEKMRLRTNPLPDRECARPDPKRLNSRELHLTEVTNSEYRCFHPSHSFPPTEASMPAQVNWYEALAYAAYQRTTLPSRASVDAKAVPSPKGTPEKTGNLSRAISTWCGDMDVARDEKQFSLLSASSSYRSTSPCLAKGRSALLKEKRKFNVFYSLPETVVQ